MTENELLACRRYRFTAGMLQVTYNKPIGRSGHRGRATAHVHAKDLRGIHPGDTGPRQCKHHHVDVDERNHGVRRCRRLEGEVGLLREGFIDGIPWTDATALE
jgi:hypothetical protein